MRKNGFTQKIKGLFSKENRKKTIIVLSAAVLVLAIGVTVAVIAANDISNALNSSARAYRNVTVTIEQTMIDLKATAQQQELLAAETTEAAEEDDQVVYDGVSEETQAEEETESSGEVVTVNTIVMQQDGDLCYEEEGDNKFYFYTKDGQAYVYYYDDMMSMEEGQWVNATAEDANVNPAFDFTTLDKIEKNMLEKVDGQYIPLNMDEVFFSIYDTEYQEYYGSRYISFEFSGGKLTTITAKYIFNGLYQVKEVYSFTYGDASVELPDISAESGE